MNRCADRAGGPLTNRRQAGGRSLRCPLAWFPLLFAPALLRWLLLGWLAVAAAVAADASVGAPAGAAGTLSPPQQVIERVSTQLAVILRDDRARLATDRAYLRRVVDELFMPNLDLERLTQLVLGPYGRDATPAQRRAFIDEFKALVINTYAHAVHEIGPWEVRYLPVRSEPVRPEAASGSRPPRVTVRTEVLRPRGNPIAVDYRMVRRMVERDERWLVYDVVIEGVSLLVNYRNTFTGIARERGIDGLIGDLRRRNATAPD